MATTVLQLGGDNNWAKTCQLSSDLKWHFNDFLSNKLAWYSVVILTGRVDFPDQLWEELLWSSTPYSVFYQAGLKEQLSPAARRFLKLTVAKQFHETPQKMAELIERKYFFGQTGIRLRPNDLVIDERHFHELDFPDGGHLRLMVNSQNWEAIGSYRQALYVDPHRQLKLWLEAQHDSSVAVRLVAYPLDNNDQGKYYYFPVNAEDRELVVPTPITTNPQFITIGVQARGHGHLKLGMFHYRWARYGAGEYIAGGHRLINPANNEEVAYYFNPGDMKPPLNVYFAGARSMEGFEAYPLFRNLHAPSLLFTDPRLEVGQFYTGDYIEAGVRRVIRQTLIKLGFTTADLITAGTSMGSYAALRFGAQLGAHGIFVRKEIANLGYVASRSRFDRPDEFEAAFDIDAQLIDHQSPTTLKQLDRQFWMDLNATDLSKTRLFMVYMKNDDYDNHAIHDLLKSPAIAQSRQFVYQGYRGHHNDETEDVINWFVFRIRQMMRTDFGRKEPV
ncbi:accessory Sec system protein Asp2 [Limosilactobacillus sp.]|uniref:accessory Sec system protein Asp2 n=1 Tax=Limosilactobacillus sp. TaxID=2773925 RepID=UPI00359F25F4